MAGAFSPAQFSPAQQKAALWADPGARVHAVIDARVVPGLPARLAAADLLGWDCLLRGALEPEAAEHAPYLVDLREQSPFTDWLLGEAGTAFPGWGVLMVSALALLPMRQHCRELSEVMLPDGSQRTWRWFDPQVWELILPSLSPGQLDEVFAPGLSYVVPLPAAWTWHRLDQGLLVSTPRVTAAAAAG